MQYSYAKIKICNSARLLLLCTSEILAVFAPRLPPEVLVSRERGRCASIRPSLAGFQVLAILGTFAFRRLGPALACRKAARSGICPGPEALPEKPPALILPSSIHACRGTNNPTRLNTRTNLGRRVRRGAPNKLARLDEYAIVLPRDRVNIFLRYLLLFLLRTFLLGCRF